MLYFKPILLLLISFFVFSSCNRSEKSKPKANELGELNFKVTGSEEAQDDFKKGLLLLHSFEYEDAREAFEKTQAIDTNFLMAYWGEAMSHHHALWQKQDQEKARLALNNIDPDPTARVELAKTEIEKDFIKAANILFGEGTKYDRDVAYKQHMEALTKKYPDNHEVAAFYAISLLGSSRNGRDEELYEKSAKIAQGIIAENPNHPGALHYLIHSYDDPEHAQFAKTAADSYAKVAPDAAHALHMPSHIYVALGNWDDVVKSNIASWNASVKRMKRKDLDNDSRSYHALNWLQYGLLQKGEYDAAQKLLTNMANYAAEQPSKVAKSYLVAMKGAQMIESNSWDADVVNIPLESKGLNLVKRAGHRFIDGMKAFNQKDKKQMLEIIQEMKKDRNNSMLMIGEKGFAMCSSSGFANKPPNQLDIDMVHVMEMELKAYVEQLNANPNAVKDWFEKAIALEEGLSYSYGPPSILKPIHEAYGEWLLEQKEAKQALAMFDKSLERHPRRLLSLQGKKAAANMLNSKSILEKVDKELAISLAKNKNEIIL